MDVIGGACEPVGRRTTSTRDPPGIGELSFYARHNCTYTNIYIYIYIYIHTHIYICIDKSSPGLHSAGVLIHCCLGLEPSNGRDRRCLRARGPQDHLHSRQHVIDDFFIIKTHLYIQIYLFTYLLTTFRQASSLWAC